LSWIAIAPPFWPILPIGKEKRLDLTFLEDREFGALENKLVGAHHAHGFRFTLDRRRHGAYVLWNDWEPDLLE
jgi:hypothetical protein